MVKPKPLQDLQNKYNRLKELVKSPRLEKIIKEFLEFEDQPQVKPAVIRDDLVKHDETVSVLENLKQHMNDFWSTVKAMKEMGGDIQKILQSEDAEELDSNLQTINTECENSMKTKKEGDKPTAARARKGLVNLLGQMKSWSLKAEKFYTEKLVSPLERAQDRMQQKALEIADRQLGKAQQKIQKWQSKPKPSRSKNFVDRGF
ncbi:MAG: hypothetical protein ACD_21C00222G0002 [uncultured bacterium]|nr:MAG: hypothetical protein ACD_21C00222G0002 [uncultured bacterium]